MKHRSICGLTLSLLCSACGSLEASLKHYRAPLDLKQAKHSPVQLKSHLLELVDGTQYVDVGEIMFFARNLLALLEGTTPTHAQRLHETFDLEVPDQFFDDLTKKDTIGLIYVDGVGYTFKEIVGHEQGFGFDAFAQKGLTNACRIFEKIAEKYEEDLDQAKYFMVRIVENWCEARERHDSIMTKWSEVDTDKREELYKMMNSCESFNMFIHELLLFLKDLIQNCPKSYQIYKNKAHAAQQ